MAIRTSGVEHAFGRESGIRMLWMALFAQKRFPEFQEVIVDGTMRGVAGATFFRDVAMFEKKRP